MTQCCNKLDGCTWFIHITLGRLNRFYYVMELYKEHSYFGAFFSSKKSSDNLKNCFQFFVEEVYLKPSYALMEALRHFEKWYGSMISYHHAWLEVEKANKELFGDFELSFDKLQWYTTEVKGENPCTVIDVEYCNETNLFIRFFLAFDACIKSFNYCGPILALDG